MAAKLGGVLGVIGAILLIVALFTAFYTSSFSYNGTDVSLSFFLNNKVGLTMSGGGVSISHSSTYADSHLNSTGNLYNIVTYLTYAGIALGLLGAILAFMGRSGAGRGLLVIALILALIGPMLLFALQPAAIQSDTSGASSSGPSGANSFFGSCSGNGCGNIGAAAPGNVSQSWGPDVGWYMSIGAFVMFLLGVLLGGGAKPAPAAAAAPSMAGTGSGGSSGTTANTCSTCGASFGSAEELAAHAQSAHGGSS